MTLPAKRKLKHVWRNISQSVFCAEAEPGIVLWIAVDKKNIRPHGRNLFYAGVDKLRADSLILVAGLYCKGSENIPVNFLTAMNRSRTESDVPNGMILYFSNEG